MYLQTVMLVNSEDQDKTAHCSILSVSKLFANIKANFHDRKASYYRNVYLRLLKYSTDNSILKLS